MTTISLTEDEKRVLTKATMEPTPDSYSYCKACWNIMQNKVQAAQLFRGMMQVNLTRLGVRNANQIADRYYQFMVNRTAKKTS